MWIIFYLEKEPKLLAIHMQKMKLFVHSVSYSEGVLCLSVCQITNVLCDKCAVINFTSYVCKLVFETLLSIHLFSYCMQLYLLLDILKKL